MGTKKQCKVCGENVSWFPNPRKKRLCFSCWWVLYDKVEAKRKEKRAKQIDRYFKSLSNFRFKPKHDKPLLSSHFFTFFN